MIPIRLTLKGIYSYIDTQTIEFNNLTDSALFGIFGAVGSGKSTILEAISFALYGETERLNKKDSRNYNMMNLKSNELLIDFEFYTHTKDQPYRFIVKGKRNKKNFEDVKSFSRTALYYTGDKNHSDNKKVYKDDIVHWTPTDKTAEQIIGLNYDNFKRTIIIPQGKFKEFLELGCTERTTMLKDIFNLQRFDLSAKLKTIYSENKSKLDTLKGKMEHYLRINSKALEDKQLEQKQLLIIDKEQQSELKTLKDEFLILTNIKDLANQLTQAEFVLKQLQSSKKLFSKRKQDLTDFKACKDHFSDQLNTEYRLQNELNKHTLQLQSLTTTITEKQKIKLKLESELNHTHINYDKKDTLLAESKELQAIVSIRKLINDNNALVERVKNGDAIIETQKIDIKKQQQLREAEKKSLAGLKQNIANLSQLNNVKIYLLKKLELITAYNKTNQEVKNFKKALETLNKNQQETIGEQFYSSNPIEIKDKLNLALEKLTQSQKQLNEQLNHLSAQQKLKQWADNLEQGSACPVCGSENHPDILNMHNLQTQLDSLEHQIIGNNKDIKSINQLVSDVEKNELETNNINKLLDDKKLELEQITTTLSLHKANPVNNSEQAVSDNDTENDNKDLSIEKIEELIKQTEQTNHNIKLSEEKINNFETDINKLDKLLSKYIDAHQKFKDKHIALDATIKNEIDGLKLYSLEQLENEADNVLAIMIQSKQDIVKKAIADFDRLSHDCEQVNSELDKFQGQQSTLNELLKDLSQQYQEVTENLDKTLLNSKYSQLEQVKQLLKRHLDEQKESQAIADYEAKLKLAIAQADTLQLNLDDKLRQNKLDQGFDEAYFLKLEKTINEQQANLTQLAQQIAIIQNETTKLKEDLEQKNKLELAFKLLDDRKENISILSKLFKAQGFVNYISTVYLQNLCEAANDRFFKITRQQLKLEINDNNEFQVRDYLNEGKTRSIKTLSGGQVFQASLALALALADSVQKQIQAEHNFFFLDEGFGSLDNESLHIVFSALKSLKEENRIVGVISHVENLKQEIDIHLQVNKDDEQGSSVNYSWS